MNSSTSCLVACEKPTRISIVRLALLLPMAAAVAACADEGPLPPAPRTLQVALADGKPLPSVFACPAPFGEGSEAWVTFGSGTLVLHGNGGFAWNYTVGDGYSYHGPAGVKVGHARSGSESGTYRIGAGGELSLYNGARLVATGRLSDQGAELEGEPLSCPHPPVDESTGLVTETPQHRFSLVLR